MSYIWADTPTIQLYLAAGSKLSISDSSVPETSVQVYENEAVFEIMDILSAAWSGFDAFVPLGTSPVPAEKMLVPERLARMSAKLTASRVATLNLGTALADLPGWVKSFESQVFSQCQRMVLNHGTIAIEGLTVHEGLDIGDLLSKIKIRQQVMSEDV